MYLFDNDFFFFGGVGGGEVSNKLSKYFDFQKIGIVLDKKFDLV